MDFVLFMFISVLASLAILIYLRRSGKPSSKEDQVNDLAYQVCKELSVVPFGSNYVVMYNSRIVFSGSLECCEAFVCGSRVHKMILSRFPGAI
jgi:hypothetical protein